jgi:hypothetical protein
MDVQIESVQPGWTVVSADGEEVGTVARVEGGTIYVKKGGFLGGELAIPSSACRDIETGRVELSMTKKEADDLKA